MRKSYNAAHVYMIVGVVSGLFYREFTKVNHFTGETQLARENLGLNRRGA
ncbi:DUF2871 family protein [Sorangium sp. So ce302]